MSPEANLELRPTDTCQFPEFIPGSRPFTICAANSNVPEYRRRVRDVHRHCGVSNDNFSLSVMQVDIHMVVVVHTTP